MGHISKAINPNCDKLKVCDESMQQIKSIKGYKSKVNQIRVRRALKG